MFWMECTRVCKVGMKRCWSERTRAWRPREVWGTECCFVLADELREDAVVEADRATLVQATLVEATSGRMTGEPCNTGAPTLALSAGKPTDLGPA